MFQIIEMEITALKNNLMGSNCYLIEHLDRVIVVDPGINNVHVIAERLNHRMQHLDYVILTHEHIDHIQGVKPLCEMFDVEVIATATCFESLKNPKLNLSAAYPGEDPISYVPRRVVSVESLGAKLQWNDVQIKFYPTPGHCAGAMCFVVGDFLFSGDTLLERIKTYTTAPDSSIEQLAVSLTMIRNEFGVEMMVYPGHESCFRFGDVIPFIDSQIRLLRRKILLGGNKKA